MPVYQALGHFSRYPISALWEEILVTVCGVSTKIGEIHQAGIYPLKTPN
jgi:hypothetical protein